MKDLWLRKFLQVFPLSIVSIQNPVEGSLVIVSKLGHWTPSLAARNEIRQLRMGLVLHGGGEAMTCPAH